MPQYIDGYTRYKIQQYPPIAVPYPRALTTYKRYWLAFECSLVILLFKCNPVAFIGFRRRHRFLLQKKVLSVHTMLTRIESILVDVAVSQVTSPCCCFILS